MTASSIPSVLVLGGYGTFGRRVVEELATPDVSVGVAGRDFNKCSAVAAHLGDPHHAVTVDAADQDACSRALEHCDVVVNCTGPFSEQDNSLLEACLGTACNYVDLTDNRAHAELVRSYHDRFLQRDLTAAYGCSSLPSISTAAAIAAHGNQQSPPDHIRVTLFIGNDNRKGRAAVTSAASQLGRPIHAPQHTLLGFRDAEVVDLPPPFGRRRVLNFQSPDYDLLPDTFNAASVVVKVGFELRLATLAFNGFATFAPRLGRWLLPRLVPFAGVTRRIGCSGGVVMSELFYSDGSSRRASVTAPTDGQRMAVLPAVYVARRLLQNKDCQRGVETAAEFLGAQNLLDQLAANGIEILVD